MHLTTEREVSGVAAQVVGDKIHLWITDNYGDSNAVGYYLFDPESM